MAVSNYYSAPCDPWNDQQISTKERYIREMQMNEMLARQQRMGQFNQGINSGLQNAVAAPPIPNPEPHLNPVLLLLE